MSNQGSNQASNGDPTDPNHPTLRKGRQDAPGPPPARALLHILYTPKTQIPGRTAPLFEGDVCSIGRNVTSPDVLLDDPCASRLHARIGWDPDQGAFRLEDAGSANGTFVNGHREKVHTLSDQDVIRIGDSLLVHDERRVMDKLLARATRVAVAGLPALIIGETGTGKEVMARMIHEQSGRRGPLVPLNCAALPRDLAAAELFGHTRGAFSGAGQARAGLFASASGGTLFLDEIGDLPLDLQPALLRALQEQTVRPVGADREVAVDVRVIGATNIDLQKAITAQRFRADLYARLAQAVLVVPPLRERRSEIPALVRGFADEHARPLQYTPDALECLLLGTYRYNVRELKALIGEFFAVSKGDGAVPGLLDVDYLSQARPELTQLMELRPPATGAGREGGASVDAPALAAVPAAERERLARLLDSHAGNISAVAKELGKPRAQIYRWLRRFGLSPRQHRR
jgi:transcriptional regulator with GAF, ATPase, and Fis domain